MLLSWMDGQQLKAWWHFFMSCWLCGFCAFKRPSIQATIPYHHKRRKGKWAALQITTARKIPFIHSFSFRNSRQRSKGGCDDGGGSYNHSFAKKMLCKTCKKAYTAVVNNFVNSAKTTLLFSTQLFLIVSFHMTAISLLSFLYVMLILESI